MKITPYDLRCICGRRVTFRHWATLTGEKMTLRHCGDEDEGEIVAFTVTSEYVSPATEAAYLTYRFSKMLYEGGGPGQCVKHWQTVSETLKVLARE